MNSSPENSSPGSRTESPIENSSSSSSTSSKHSSHTLERSNTISVVVSVSPTRTEPPYKKLKSNEEQYEIENQLGVNQFDEMTSNTVNDEELNLIFGNQNVCIEYLRLILIQLKLTNHINLPTDLDFLTTESIFRSQDIIFPVNMKSISTYQLNQNLTLTIGILSLDQPLNLPDGMISLENAKRHNLYAGVIDEWTKHFNIENIHFISVDMEIYAFIESTIFPFWRWRSYVDVSHPTEWRNNCRIHKPHDKTSIIWPWSLIIMIDKLVRKLFGC